VLNKVASVVLVFLFLVVDKLLHIDQYLFNERGSSFCFIFSRSGIFWPTTRCMYCSSGITLRLTCRANELPAQRRRASRGQVEPVVLTIFSWIKVALSGVYIT
jgi:hypothetical protein